MNPFFDAKLKHAISERQAVPRRNRSSVLVLRPSLAFAAVAVLVSLLLFVPPGQFSLNDLNGKLSTNELASGPQVSGIGAVQVDPLALTEQETVPGSYVPDRVSTGGKTDWSAPDAHAVSYYGSGGSNVAAGYDMAYAKDAVLEVEFVLDPFFMEGTEVRRLETASVPGVEPELVSMTF